MQALTRRQWLTTVGAATILPYLPARATEKPMRGAFIIMSTPYTNDNEIDYVSLARQVDFFDRCGIHGPV